MTVNKDHFLRLRKKMEKPLCLQKSPESMFLTGLAIIRVKDG